MIGSLANLAKYATKLRFRNNPVISCGVRKASVVEKNIPKLAEASNLNDIENRGLSFVKDFIEQNGCCEVTLESLNKLNKLV